jgi:transcriptional regulator with PAS, ATPase and Fis domain
MCNGSEILPEDITLAAIRQDEQFISSEKTLQEYTQDIIHFYLKKYNNNVVYVAVKLDIGKSTIYKTNPMVASRTRMKGG